MQGPQSIGLMWWLLAREVLRLRGTISREHPWEVMVDLYFYRDPEEVPNLCHFHTPASKTKGGMLFKLCPAFLPSVTNTVSFLSNHASHRLPNSGLPVFYFLFYDFVCLLSFHPQHNIFSHNFLSTHASEPLQTWYSASARGPTHHLLTSGVPVICFLFTT